MTNYVTLHDGTEIDLHAPDFTGVSLETIGLMLYRQLRYNGATKRPYCVLEHTLRGVRACLDPQQSPGLGVYARRTAMHFLIHDMHEVATGDIAAPVARAIGADQIDKIKRGIDLAIYDRFGTELHDAHIRECIIAVDQVMFQREWMDLMPTGFDRAAPGGHDGPTRDFMAAHLITPEPIDAYHCRSSQDMIGEFCHLWRVVRG